MKTVEEIAFALRCCATPGRTTCEKGKDCPYYLLEEIDTELPVKPDVVIDGVGFWTSCDCDQISMDAAVVLEEIAKEEKVTIDADE